MPKDIKSWRPALLRWKRNLPHFVRRWLAGRWKAQAERIADKVEWLIPRGQALTVAAQQIEPETASPTGAGNLNTRVED